MTEIVSYYKDTVFIGDRSHSMISMGDSPLKGARGFLGRVSKNDSGVDQHIEFVVFSENKEVVYSGLSKELKETDIERCVKAMIFSGATRFYDTLLEAIADQDARLTRAWGKLSPYVKRLTSKHTFGISTITIVTDGYDNKSANSVSDVRIALQHHCKKWGCVPIYLGANVDAEQEGTRLGVDKGLCLQMGSDPQHSQHAMEAMVDITMQASNRPSSLGLTPTFSQNQRMRSCESTEYLRCTSNSDQRRLLSCPSLVPRLSMFVSQIEPQNTK